MDVYIKGVTAWLILHHEQKTHPWEAVFLFRSLKYAMVT